MTELGPINIPLTASGIQEVLKAFSTVEARCAAFEKKLEQLTNAGAKQRQTAAEREAAARVKAAEKAAKEAAKLAEKEAKAKDKSEKDKTKSAEKEAKNREKIAAKEAAAVAREAKKASDAAIREAKKLADAEMREAKRSANARAAYSKNLAGQITGNFRGVLGTVSNIFGSITALGGGLTLANAVSKRMSLQSNAAKFAIRSNHQVNAGEVSAQAQKVAKLNNIDPNDFLATAEQIGAKTGDRKKALGVAEQVSFISKSQGMEPSELGEAIASAMAQNPELTDENITNLLKLMVQMNKSGLDMSQVSDAVKTAPQYGGQLVDAQAKLIGLKSALKGADVGNLAGDFVQNKDKFKALGIETTNAKGQLNDPAELVRQAIIKTGGSTDKLSGLFGEKTVEAISPFAQKFIAAKASGQKDEQASETAMKAYNDAIRNKITAEQLEADHKEMLATTTEKLTSIFNQLTDKTGEKLLPALEKLVPNIEKAADALSKFVELAADHPWATVAAAISASLVKSIAVEMAASGLKDVIAKGILALMGGAAPGAVAGGVGAAGTAATGVAGAAAGRAGLGMLGKAGLVGAAGLAGFGIGSLITDQLDENNEEEKKSIIEKQKRANQLLTSKKDANWLKEATDLEAAMKKQNSQQFGLVFGDTQSQADLSETQRQQLVKQIEKYKSTQADPQQNAALKEMKEQDERNTKATEDNTEATKKLAEAMEGLGGMGGGTTNVNEVNSYISNVINRGSSGNLGNNYGGGQSNRGGSSADF